MILPQLDPATLRAQRSGLDGLRATLEGYAAKALRAAEQLPLEGKASLHYYPPQRRAVRRPVLLIYSLINRPQILDLTEDRSFVGRLRQLGHAVYVVDWGRPDVTDAGVSLADYVTGYLPMAVHALRSRHRAHSVDVVGVCQGGTLGLCLASLNPDLVHRLVTLATPVDFHTAGDMLAALAACIEPRRLLGVDGNLEGRALANLFRLLTCLRDGDGSQPPWLDPDQVLLTRRLRQWQADCPDQAGRAWLDFVIACYRNNDLIAGRLSFGGTTVELQRLEVPVLNVVARADHLVPPRASLALGRLVAATGYRELLIDGGHLAALIGRRGLATVPAAVSRFLRAGPSRRRSN